MQFASPSHRLQVQGGLIYDRVKGSMSGGRLWSAILVLLLTFTISRSTSTFHWVDGIDSVTPIAIFGALILGALALSPIMEPIALTIGVVLAVPVALMGTWPQIHARHPNIAFGPDLITLGRTEIKDGTLGSDTAFYLFLICILMWVTGAWLSWCVLRWRKPMLGLIPGAAAFATNLLNIAPGDSTQNGFTLAMMVLTISLLLWTSYSSSIWNATRARVKLSGDARWDFWESGLVAMTAIIVLGIFLPPFSTTDRTTAVETGVFASWAQLQEQLNHPGVQSGLGGVGTTGFSEEVKLVGALQRTKTPVFEYSITGDYGGPRYFRGTNATELGAGTWRYSRLTNKIVLAKNQPARYGESYDALGVAGFTIKMLHAPNGYGNVLFYPGQLYKIDRLTQAEQGVLFDTPDLMTIDRLDSVQPANSNGGYTVYTEFSGATVAQLEAAGTDYPAWVQQFAVAPKMPRVALLAHDVTAGTTNPYDAATAVESYLRSKFNYDLSATPPQGVDPLNWFLFTSHTGYCEYFATAMGDMLRSLGIPTRLVNGYGPGAYDNSIQQYVVRGEDAHTWVEVYFPKYGWIPFEPTPDSGGLYSPITRGTVSNVCLREQGCAAPGDTNLPSGGNVVPTPKTKPEPVDVGPAGPSGFGVSIFQPGTLTKVAGAVIAIVLLLLVLALRYLRPRTVMGVWQRLLTLSNLAGAAQPPGETPLELGRRLGQTFPEGAEPVGELARSFAVAAYAPPDVAATAHSSVMEAWITLRPMLLRRVLARLRPTRP